MTIFVDTNVLVYARDASTPRKQPQALDWLGRLWRTEEGRTSFQVLHEYYVTVTRKLSPGLTPDEARQDIRDLLAWRPLVADERMLEEAFALENRFKLSFWDALVVSAAQLAGCRYLLTEDLQHGQDLDGVEVVNPFLAVAGEFPPT